MERHQHNFFEDFPSELIHHIVYCLDLHSIDDPQARRFLSVCSAFRRAIINTQRLYELMVVNIDRKSTDGMRKWMQLKVERSKPSRNVHVYLIGRDESVCGGPIFDVVMGCCDRWGILNLEIHPNSLETLLRSAEGRLESLRKIHLTFFPNTRQEMRSLVAVIPPCFRHLPMLDDVIIMPLPARNLSLLPLHQVAHCKLALSSDAREVQAALSALFHPQSRLKTLVLQMHPEGTESWGGEDSYCAHHLLDLEVISDPYGDRDRQARDYTKLLDKLTAPSLDNLSAWFDNISSTTYRRLAERSRWTPESFKIHWNSPFDDIMPFFTLSSTLTMLILRIDDLGRLSHYPQFKDPTFLPNLKSWRLVASWERYNDGRLVTQHLTNPLGETGSLRILDDIGLARCELQNPLPMHLGKPELPSHLLLSFEIDLLDSYIAKGTTQIIRRLPLEELGLDMEVLHRLKVASGTLEWRHWSKDMWSDEDVDRASTEVSDLVVTFQKVNTAQYLYHSGIHFVLDDFIGTMPKHPGYFFPGSKHTDAFKPGSQISSQLKALLKCCLHLLREDIPRLRWRFHPTRKLIYTPEFHEYKLERNVMQMVFGREEVIEPDYE